MLNLKKKDKLGSSNCEVLEIDIERKIELLTSVLDTASCVLNIIVYFRKEEKEKLFCDEKVNIIMENLFYELIFAREEAWIMGKYRGEIFLIIDCLLA